MPTTSGTSDPAFFAPFHFSVINPGGSLLAISDANTHFRLVLPLCSTIPLRFTGTSTEPYGKMPLNAWTMNELAKSVENKHGVKAKEWKVLAEGLVRWWLWKQRERWDYWGNSRELGRGGSELGGGVGRMRKEHWWET